MRILLSPDAEPASATSQNTLNPGNAPAPEAPAGAASPESGRTGPRVGDVSLERAATDSESEDAIMDAAMVEVGVVKGKPRQAEAAATQEQDPPAAGVSAGTATATPPPSATPNATAARTSLDSPDKRLEFARAENALRRAGLSASVLGKMSTEDILSDGKEAASRQAKIDRMRPAKGAQTDSRTSDDGAHPAQESRTSRDGRTRTTDAADRRSAGQSERDPEPDGEDPLDELDSWEPEPEPSRREQRRQPEPAVDPEVESLRRENAETKQRLHTTWIESGLRDAEQAFPQVKEREHQQRIGERMRELDPDRRALREGSVAVARLVEQACFIEYGPQMAARSRAAEKTAAQLILDAQPSNPSGRVQRREPTDEEVEDAALAAIEAGGADPNKVRAELNRRLGG